MPDTPRGSAARPKLPHDKGLLATLAVLPVTGAVALVFIATTTHPHIPKLVAAIGVLLSASIGGCLAGMSYGRWQVYAKQAREAHRG